MNFYYPEGMLIGTPQNYEYTASERGLERALERGAILEGVAVLCDHEMNLHVSLGGGIRGIIPRGEVEYSRGESTKDIASFFFFLPIVCSHASRVVTAGKSTCNSNGKYIFRITVCLL